MGGGFDLLEHTADVGVHAWGGSLAEAFEQAAWGMVEILGARAAGAGERRLLRASGHDEGALLVDFLNELLLVHETAGVAVAGIRVRAAAVPELEAEVWTRPLAGAPEGVAVKAATLHQLRVERDPGGRVDVRVYLDV